MDRVIAKAKTERMHKISNDIGSIFRFIRGKKMNRAKCNMSLEKSISKANEIDACFSQVAIQWFADLNQNQRQRQADFVSWRHQRIRVTNSRAIPEVNGPQLKTMFFATKKNTAPGYDKITDKLIECFGDKQWSCLARIINRSSISNVFPTVWKHALLIALEKPTGGYRPISLLSKLSKLYERLILNELIKHTELPDWQFCCKGRSAPLAVTILHHRLVHEWWNDRTSVVAFFDIRKAFDSISHSGLLKRLTELKVPVGLIQLIDSWLESRTVQTCFNGMYSNIRTKTLGIPQGSPLSLMLFMLYISDLPIIPDVDLFGYADDIAIKIPCSNENTERVTQVCKQVLHWAGEKLLHMNINKLEILHVNPMNQIEVDLGNGIVIRSKDQVKYLGIQLHSSLYFDEHIRTILPELKRRTNIIRGLCWRSPPRLYLQVYKMVVRSKLAYCGHLLTYCKSIKPLETVQNTNLRNVLRAYFTTPILTLRAATQVPSIALYSQYLKCTFMLHLNKSGKRVHTDCRKLLSPIDQGHSMIQEKFRNQLPTKKQLKKLMRKDMISNYRQYSGCFRFMYPRFPVFKFYRSPDLTSMAFRAATGHMNIGSHRRAKRIKGNYNCRYCNNRIETLQHLLAHHRYRTRHRFFDVLRGSRGTEVDRIRLFRIMKHLRL